MIYLENVTKFYRYKGNTHYVLKDITYTIPPKVNIAILGPNGAGKSTLLRLIGGMELPNEGKIYSPCKISWPIALGETINPSLTARENIRFISQIYGKSMEETNDIITYVEDFAEIEEYFDIPVKTYSSGMRARINFGLSMAFDFDYYLVDEVTSVGDRYFREKAKKIFKEKKEKTSIIIASHDMNTIRENCAIGIFINKGEFKVYENIDDAIFAYQKVDVSKLKWEALVIKHSGLFDIAYYKEKNRDALGNMDPIFHFCWTGWKEYRNPSKHFDIKLYLNQRPRLADTGNNPFVHYIQTEKKG